VAKSTFLPRYQPNVPAHPVPRGFHPVDLRRQPAGEPQPRRESRIVAGDLAGRQQRVQLLSSLHRGPRPPRCGVGAILRIAISLPNGRDAKPGEQTEGARVPAVYDRGVQEPVGGEARSILGSGQGRGADQGALSSAVSRVRRSRTRVRSDISLFLVSRISESRA